MSVDVIQPYEPDRSMVGKLRRRLVRLYRRRPARGSRHSRPLLSLSFDDVPASAATVGADILRTHGLKAAYYISAGLIGQDGHMGPHVQWSDIERLHAEGHEIGCHTFDHTDLGQADADVSRRAVADNRAAFEAHGMPTPRTFAYPYGDVSFAPKTVLAPHFDLLRALHHGLVEGGTDLNQAPSVGLEGPNGEVTAIAWLRRAAQRKAWLILNGHDVQPNPSPWGCTPDTLRRVIDEALALGFEIVTVSEGVRRTA